MVKTYNSSIAPREDVAFHCTYSSAQSTVLKWYKGLNRLSNSSHFVITNYDGGSTLTIVDATRNDIDRYKCEVTSGGRTKTKSGTLDVRGEYNVC